MQDYNKDFDNVNEIENAVVYDDDSFAEKSKSNSSRSGKGRAILSAIVALAVFAGTVVAFSVPEFVGNKKADNTLFETPSVAKPITSENVNIQTGQELSTQEIAALVGPAVVGIENIGTSNFYYYQTDTTLGSGSGVIISDDGYIVTNFHVIENATKLNVTLSTGEKYQAKVVGYDDESDLALLKIDGKDLPNATFGDSSMVTVGDRAIAIGNPLGTELMGTVTQGIISAVNRNVRVDNRTMTLIQTDAAINSGNSGGALINAYGEVIGINSVKMAASGVEGLGFAIPSNSVKSIIDDLRNHGYVRGRLTIGISGTNITEKMAAYYDLPMGFFVQEVYQGSGAAQAGMQPGDIVVKCDGKLVKTIDDINNAKKTHKVGETMVLQVVREGKNITLHVVLQEEKPETAW